MIKCINIIYIINFLLLQVDGKVDEALVLLRNHLQHEDVLTRLSSWEETETPTQQIWQEVDTALRLV